MTNDKIRRRRNAATLLKTNHGPRTGPTARKEPHPRKEAPSTEYTTVEYTTVEYITVQFNRRGRMRPLGTYDGRIVCVWSGDDQPQLGETWECRIITQWNTGMMVRPLKRVDNVEGV